MKFKLLWGIVKLWSLFLTSQGCFIDPDLTSITLLEGTKAGLLANLSSSDNVGIIDFVANQYRPSFLVTEGGAFYLKGTLDFDRNKTLCDSSPFWSSITFQCQLNNTIQLKLVIQVQYTDDIDPEIRSNLSTTVPELSPVGLSIFNIREHVTDEDCRWNVPTAGLAFALVSGNEADKFEINVVSGLVTLKTGLDFESGDTVFYLNVSVITQHSTTRKAFTLLTVNVHDEDDTDPFFSRNNYELHVLEEEDPDDAWLKTNPPIEAFDGDLQVNATLEYLLADGKNSSNILEINGTSGEIKLKQKFDREVNESVRVVLKVIQVDNTMRSAFATLTIIVDDINDNRPLFQPHEYENVTVAEHSAVGTMVVLVSATDKDKAGNGAFKYTLVNGSEVFNIRSESYGQLLYGVLTVANSSKLDRETSPFIVIMVNTQENNPPAGGDCSAGFCTATVTISLTDINDNSPVFLKDTYHFVVENNTSGGTVGTVNATDADIGDNARLSYSINSLPSGCNNIDIKVDTGDLILKFPMAMYDVCSTLVRACDSPSDPSQRRCSQIPVRIALQSDTIFNETSYNASVPENQAAGYIVLLFPESTEGFYLDSNVFNVYDRLLTTSRMLDREEQNHYQLFIQTNNKERTNITVNVKVDDVNDNAPIFNVSTKEIILNEHDSPGRIIVVAQAFDLDEGENARLTYIQLSEFWPYFFVNQTSGVVTLLRVPHLNLDAVDLIIIASDNGMPKLSNTITFKVYLGGINGTVRITAQVPVDILTADKEHIQNELSRILDASVTVETIRQAFNAYSSSLYVTAKNGTTHSVIPQNILQSLINSKSEEIAQLFAKYGQKGDNDDSPMTAPVIALIVVAAVLILALFLVIVIFARKNSRYKREKRLVENISRKQSMYADVQVEERSQTDTLAEFIPDMINTNELRLLNPAYANSIPNLTDPSQKPDEHLTNISGLSEAETRFEADVKQDVGRDADSGVPSDRENGPDDSDDSSEESSQRESPGDESQQARNAVNTYLSAVLNEKLLSSSVRNGKDSNMVDATPPVPEGPITGQNPEYVNISPAVEERGFTVQFFDEDPDTVAEAERSQVGLFPPKTTLADLEHVENTDQDLLDELDSPPEMSFTSHAGFSFRPPTPPTPHRPKTAEEEEEEYIPEEPLPDYAKKVRFNVQVVAHDVPKDKDKDHGEANGDIKSEEFENRGNDPLGIASVIKESKDAQEIFSEEVTSL